MSGRRRIRAPRRIRPGTLPNGKPGERLDCLVLSRGPHEWIGADLASGAFVRVPGGIDAPIDDADRSGLVVEFTLGVADPSPDPARPELALPATVPTVVGTLRPRAVRRFLSRLATPEATGATILGTRGPSIAFVDLDGTAASIQLLAVPVKHLELAMSDRNVPVCAIPWGGAIQRTRVDDDRAAHATVASAPRALRGPQIAAALGFRPSFVLVGLGRVTDGHVPKVVLALL